MYGKGGGNEDPVLYVWYALYTEKNVSPAERRHRTMALYKRGLFVYSMYCTVFDMSRVTSGRSTRSERESIIGLIHDDRSMKHTFCWGF